MPDALVATQACLGYFCDSCNSNHPVALLGERGRRSGALKVSLHTTCLVYDHTNIEMHAVQTFVIAAQNKCCKQVSTVYVQPSMQS